MFGSFIVFGCFELISNIKVVIIVEIMEVVKKIIVKEFEKSRVVI